MSLSCNVVQDLIVLFQEDAVSEETGAEVRKHLKECRECRRVYREYTRMNQEEISCEEEPRPEHELVYSEIAARIRRSKFWNRLVVTAAFALGIGITVTVTRAILRGEK